jgi:ankyrin repeat protein
MTKTLPRKVQSNPKQKKPRIEEVSPKAYLRSLFGAAEFVGTGPKSFLKPKEEDTEAYDLELVRAVRSQDIKKLRELFSEGKSMNACNQFGESLLHMACRRGDLEIVQFMIREAKVRVDIHDDFGRNPFHDACWTSKPNFDVMDVLIEAADPFMIITEDVRGSSPFDYARRENYGKWLKYLDEKKEVIQRKIKLVQAPI